MRRTMTLEWEKGVLRPNRVHTRRHPVSLYADRTSQRAYSSMNPFSDTPPMRHFWQSAVLALGFLVCGCQPREGAQSAGEKAALADSLKRRVAAAYDFSRSNVPGNLMSLYPDTGRVVAAAAGRVTTTRDALQHEIAAFWDNVGRNMRNPRWIWEESHVDVLSRDAAVMTATYRIPHTTPAGAPHEIRGAWTAVFVRSGGRWVIVQEHLSDSDTPEGPVNSSASPDE